MQIRVGIAGRVPVRSSALILFTTFSVALPVAAQVPASIALDDPSPSPLMHVAAPGAQLGFRPVVGQERYYDIHSKGVAGINFEALAARVSPSSTGPAKGKMQDHRFDVTARLGMRVLAQVGDEWHVAMRLADVRYEVDGQVEQRTTPLQTAFLVRASSRGELRSFEFPVHFPQEAQLAIRSLVEPLQVVFTSAGKDEWMVGERTAAGHSTVQYRVRGIDEAARVAQISREVTAARRSLSSGVALMEQTKFNTRVDSSTGLIEWALDGSGLKSISLREKTTSLESRQPIATSDTSFTATRVLTAVDGLPTTPAGMQEKLTDPTLARAQFYKVPGYLEQELEGVTWEEAIAFYMQRIGGEAPATVNLMKFYLRKYPARAQDLAEALNEVAKGARTDELSDVVGYGFAAMAAAGHTEAQRVLVKVLSEGVWEPLSKEKALDAMLSLEMPEVFVPAVVWNVRQERAQGSSPTKIEDLSIATNIYGALGNVELGVPEVTDEVMRKLSQILQRGDKWEKARALVAMGNIRDPSLTLPHALPYFHSPEEMLRSRAFDCFRHGKTDSVFASFAALYLQEETVFVQREATFVALTMADSPARNAWAAELVRTSTDRTIRSRAVTMLGRGIELHPENEGTLRELLGTVRDRETRKAIYAFISLKPRGAK
ncbi:MAG: hypothetical protein H0V12_06625 [Chloroflexi bacterium]|nr:hypothetical protein [Chloroflexota bacterium]